MGFNKKNTVSKWGNLMNIALLTLVALCLLCCGCQEKKKTRKSKLKIVSIPDGAKVFINGKEIGESPMALAVRPSTYIMKMSKTGYEDHWEKIICSKQSEKTVQVSLKPVTASIMLTSTPDKAKVIMNNAVVGETPLVLNNLKIGEYEAIFRKINHAPKKASWKIENSRPQRVNCELNSNVGTIRITSNPSKVSILIDGEPRGRTPFKCDIEEGAHKVRFELPGYSPQDQVVVVKRGEVSRAKANMAILPGNIQVTSRPAKARLYIAGKHYGNTPATIENLSPGVYMVRCEKSGYDSTQRKVTVMPNQTTKVEIPLTTNMGGIHLVVNPPGVTIYLDGKKRGVSEAGEDPKLSKVFSIGGLAAGKHIVRLAHKRARPKTKDIRVNVKKGQISRVHHDLWIADHELVLKTGAKFIGRLIGKEEDKGEVVFEPQPNIKMNYNIEKEVKSLTPLPEEE